MSSHQFQIDDSMYATQGQRLANLVIDYVSRIVFALGFMTAYTFFSMLMGSEEMIDLEGIGFLGEYVIGLVVLLIYYNLFEIFTARTIGKFITKTIVVNEYGEKPSINSILTRSICRAIPFNIFSFLGTPCRGWHDSISDTFVVQKDILDNAKQVFHSFDEIGKTEED